MHCMITRNKSTSARTSLFSWKCFFPFYKSTLNMFVHFKVSTCPPPHPTHHAPDRAISGELVRSEFANSLQSVNAYGRDSLRPNRPGHPGWLCVGTQALARVATITASCSPDWFLTSVSLSLPPHTTKEMRAILHATTTTTTLRMCCFRANQLVSAESSPPPSLTHRLSPSPFGARDCSK